MILSKNTLTITPLSGAEKYSLKFIPVCDLHKNLKLPYIQGTKVIEFIDFSDPLPPEAQEKTGE